jgi:hypothetical protein
MNKVLEFIYVIKLPKNVFLHNPNILKIFNPYNQTMKNAVEISDILNKYFIKFY